MVGNNTHITLIIHILKCSD